MDTLSMNTHVFHFKLNEANKAIKQLPDMPQHCEMPVSTISYEDLQQMMSGNEPIQLVDVREKEEHAAGNIGGINIPLSSINDSYHLLDPARSIVLYCASGARSSRFATLLVKQGFRKVMNLNNGLTHYGLP